MKVLSVLTATADTFDPRNVDLTTANVRDVICALTLADSGNEYNGHLGARVSSIFVILIVSSAATIFPVLAKWFPRLKLPLYVYLFARYFGAGVIVATAFIHLLDPAYDEIGPSTCVGMTGGWAVYSWCPAIVLTSVMIIFLMDFAAEWYVEAKYGIGNPHPDLEEAITRAGGGGGGSQAERISSHHQRQRGGNDDTEDEEGLPPSCTGRGDDSPVRTKSAFEKRFIEDAVNVDGLDVEAAAVQTAFRQQIAGFLILEFGIIFHSVIIGMNLGVSGDEFSTLYPVLVFHQSFEGLGIGARMSSIPFDSRSWLPWILCALYGLTTPVSIAIGLGLRTTYNPNSFTANVVSGVFDAVSAGILIYSGLVELLARDFIFNPVRTRDGKRIVFMLVSVFLGAGIMSLLGHWA
ncbi:hypothetical protein PV08_03452 [Exophiala spinifera]|uniref:Zinc-regulated transporter 1 n=1 Tax=Exophiala spinifera TaxID=91928 RepID=A0A0D2C6F9_9EURO|nr:uncharacterized protein PV08_03452 [Exophiala spinifera]KIW19159.1 hypothetical protein PV08_03452 [Exophiala spinifera]